MLWHWDVFRLDRDARVADPTLVPRWAEWVSSLGLDPNELLQDAVIRMDPATNQYVLHVTKIRRTPEGAHWIDEATMQLVSEPLIIPIGPHVVWPVIRPGSGEQLAGSLYEVERAGIEGAAALRTLEG